MSLVGDTALPRTLRLQQTTQHFPSWTQKCKFCQMKNIRASHCRVPVPLKTEKVEGSCPRSHCTELPQRDCSLCPGLEDQVPEQHLNLPGDSINLPLTTVDAARSGDICHFYTWQGGF